MYVSIYMRIYTSNRYIHTYLSIYIHIHVRMYIYMHMHTLIYIYFHFNDDMLTPTGYPPPTQQPARPTAHTAHSQHCRHTALPPG